MLALGPQARRVHVQKRCTGWLVMTQQQEPQQDTGPGFSGANEKEKCATQRPEGHLPGGAAAHGAV